MDRSSEVEQLAVAWLVGMKAGDAVAVASLFVESEATTVGGNGADQWWRHNPGYRRRCRRRSGPGHQVLHVEERPVRPGPPARSPPHSRARSAADRPERDACAGRAESGPGHPPVRRHHRRPAGGHRTPSGPAGDDAGPAPYGRVRAGASGPREHRGDRRARRGSRFHAAPDGGARPAPAGRRPAHRTAHPGCPGAPRYRSATGLAGGPHSRSPSWQDSGMDRVLGIGGYFMRAADPAALGAWYRDCLGLDTDEHGAWRQEAGQTVFATFESETDYFGSRAQQAMINFRVRDLDAMLAQLRAKGADVAEETQDMEGVGRFGWVTDPEGNRVELWQPA